MNMKHTDQKLTQIILETLVEFWNLIRALIALSLRVMALGNHAILSYLFSCCFLYSLHCEKISWPILYRHHAPENRSTLPHDLSGHFDTWLHKNYVLKSGWKSICFTDIIYSFKWRQSFPWRFMLEFRGQFLHFPRHKSKNDNLVHFIHILRYILK